VRLTTAGSAAARAARGKAFKAVCEKLRPFAFQENLTPEQAALAAEFKERFCEAVAPDLVPYYRMLAPDFFGWLDRH
jgi:hypothetical protein